MSEETTSNEIVLIIGSSTFIVDKVSTICWVRKRGFAPLLYLEEVVVSSKYTIFGPPPPPISFVHASHI